MGLKGRAIICGNRNMTKRQGCCNAVQVILGSGTTVKHFLLILLQEVTLHCCRVGHPVG